MTERAAPNYPAGIDAPPDDSDAAVVSPRRSRRRWPRRAGLGVVVIVGIAAFALSRTVSSSSSSMSQTDVKNIVDKSVGDAVKNLQNAPAHSAQVYNTIIPSIVVIQSQHAGSTGSEGDLGTGVIINGQGTIMTALHVVDGATSIRVSYTDGTQSPASIASTDPANDIATLTADRPPDVIVPAVLAGGPHVGDEAFAVGNPLGLIASLSAGVISGLDRTIPRDGSPDLHGLIQFDAAVNPGNSGGPLLNRNGQVVGIVTALANPSKSGYFIGIGFAVPIATAGGAAGAPRQ